MSLQDKPLAATGLTSYRYPSRWVGYIMIGATDDSDALREAQRSLSEGEAVLSMLEVWNSNLGRYVKVSKHAR